MENLLLSFEREARSWLVELAAPTWSTRGRTPSGLFAERVTLDGVPNDEYFRTFVQARHVYSMIVAAQLGWSGPWRELVAETINVLIKRAKRVDGFFVHRLDRNADVIDQRADLYDQAFILFALGSAGTALGDETLFNEAESLLDTVETHWSHPQGGFREGEIVDVSVRRQNPHMHLLEAFNLLRDGSGRERFARAAASIAELCQARFIDSSSGALLEYFNEDWTPATGNAGRIVEPGHCFEWAWLFENLGVWGWKDGIKISDGLTAFGRSRGIDPIRGVAINEILIDGTVVNNYGRLWPQTERLKVAVARYRRTKSAEDIHEVRNAWEGLRCYFLSNRPDLWRDKMKEDGSFVEELVPGSSLYHIACAIKEMNSLEEL